MSSMAELAHSCNNLCDRHAEHYQHTAACKFPANEIRAAIEKVNRHGFVMRLKTNEEIREDIVAYKLLPQLHRLAHALQMNQP